MTRPHFLSDVPQKVLLVASALPACGLLIGLVRGHTVALPGHLASAMGGRGAAGLIEGMLLGGWILCLYAIPFPKKIRLPALALAGLCPAIGMVVGSMTARPGYGPRTMFSYGAFGVVAGIVLGGWLLALSSKVIPKKIHFLASAIVGMCVLIGLIKGHSIARGADALRIMFLSGSAGLAIGILIGGWILCLGFVFADARRRGMRPVLWVLVAALFPHALGFLLYFVMRAPIAATCPQCGGTISNQQAFCSWCGAALVPPVQLLQQTTHPLSGNEESEGNTRANPDQI